MNRRELLKKVGLFPAVLLAGGTVGSGAEKKHTSTSLRNDLDGFFGSYRGFCLVCKACGSPLSLVQTKDGGPVALGCLRCDGTPIITGTDWDSIVRKWIDFRTVLSRDLVYTDKGYAVKGKG